MSTLAQRSLAKPQRKTFKPGRPVGSWAGYRVWELYTSTFARYVQDDLDDQVEQAYSQWVDYGHSLFAAELESDLPCLPQLALHDSGHPIAAQAAEPPKHLYALEAEDLLEFTGDDIVEAWTFRAQCCGSKEAAAETYALFRVLNGDDNLYAGATAYLNHPEVLAIFSGSESEHQPVKGSVPLPDATAELKPSVEPEPSIEGGLSLADVRGLTSEGLKAAWANRPESFASLEAAAETLAILRSLNSADPEKPTYRQMMQHELVLELRDSLPTEIHDSAPSPNVELELLRVDRRTVRTQVSVIRPGQGNFRAAMIERYGAECCVSGCRIDTLLEAAHIIPYRGDQSDDVSNGLLLRVDLHRLFDAYLISINPATLTVEVATSIDDAGYQVYHGKRLFAFSPKPRTLFLETHYQVFKNVGEAAC